MGGVVSAGVVGEDVCAVVGEDVGEDVCEAVVAGVGKDVCAVADEDVGEFCFAQALHEIKTAMATVRSKESF